MNSSGISRWSVICLGLALLGLSLWGQGTRSTVTGVVRDTTGAVVPGVDIAIINLETGVLTRTVTGDAGTYRVPHLPPGIYRIEAILPGFKTSVASRVEVRVAQVVTVDFLLEVGEVSEQIEVVGQSPLIESSSQIGVEATEREFHTWPIHLGDGVRQLQSFVFRNLPGTSGGTFRGSINGGQAFSHEILIEGLSIGRFDLTGGSNNEFTPSADMVREFKLQTGTLSSQYGGTQTSIANFNLKTGTNDYHGTVYWFHKNKVLDANSWTNNAFGRQKSPFIENNGGFSLGGPIVKDRTHFFVSYELGRRRDLRLSGFHTLPLPSFKQGDFSALLDPSFTGDPRSGTVVGQDPLGRDVIFGQIYDPQSARQLPDGSWVRDPFPNNIIPRDRFSAVSARVLEVGPTPDPVLNQFLRNTPSVAGCCPRLDVDLFGLKIDHVFSSSQKISGFYNMSLRDRINGDRLRPGAYLPLPGSPSSAWGVQSTPGHIFRLSEDWTLSPTMLNHFAIGYNRFGNKFQSMHFGTHWAHQLGLSNVGSSTFPVIFFRANSDTLGSELVRLGNELTGDEPNGSWIVADDFSWIKGRHSFRFGFELRRYYYNNRQETSAGFFTFHNEQTALPGFVNSTGFSYASFLTGAVRNADLNIVRVTPGQRVWYGAFYVQDDWKVAPRFTLNLGLRWEIPGAWTEVMDRMSGLDLSVPNPGADGFKGALVFMGDCPDCTGRRSFQDIYWKQVAPRLGFAWNAREGLVVRGGYGINYAPPIRNGFGFPFLHGFNGSNPINPGTGRFAQDFTLLWDEGYPAFTDELPNRDPTQQNGKSIKFLPPDSNRQPYVQNWNIGIQYQLPGETVFEVNYIGNKGTRLHEPGFASSLNQVDSRHLALGDVLLEKIDDHPEIPKPYPSFQGTVARALRPYPQFENISAAKFHTGSSRYDSLQVMATRRVQQGLNFLASYTFSKNLADTDDAVVSWGLSRQDFYNRHLERSPTRWWTPHMFRLTWIYDLPWGRGRRWLQEGPAGAILGGWTLSMLHRYESGAALQIRTGGLTRNALFNPGFRADVLLPGEQQVIYQGERPDSRKGTPYLNPEAFAKPPSTANGVPLRFGNAPRYLGDVRGPARYFHDLSLVKRTPLGWGEGTRLEIRADILNIFNQAGLGNPNTSATSSSFGRIFRNGQGPRTVQLGLRVSF